MNSDRGVADDGTEGADNAASRSKTTDEETVESARRDSGNSTAESAATTRESETASGKIDDRATSQRNTDTDGYVHRPGGPDAVTTDTARPDDATQEDLGQFGWVLVGTVFLAVLGVPGLIYLYPIFLSEFGLSFIGTYLILPLIPAVALGLLAVWSIFR